MLARKFSYNVESPAEILKEDGMDVESFDSE